jgi:hypothetical protein
MSEQFKDIVSKAYVNCDMRKPLEAGDPRWVDLDRAGVRGEESCQSELSRTIEIRDRQGQSSCLLFSGFSGGGKSTVLKQLQAGLEKKDFEVIYVDVEAYLNLRIPIEPYEILLAIAGEIDKKLQSPGADIKRFWDRIYNFLESEIKVPEIKVKIPEVAELKVELKKSPDFRKEIQRLIEKKHMQSKLIEKCHLFIKEYQSEFRKRNPDKKSLVIIVDSLEKLRSHREDTVIRESLINVFTQYSESLRMPCHVIYTVPPWMRFTLDWSTISTTFDEFIMLPMVKVYDPEKKIPYAVGVNVLLELINKRVNVKQIFGDMDDGWLRKVIQLTGGYPRDLLRVVQGIIGKAFSYESGPVTLEDMKNFQGMEIVALAEDYHDALHIGDVRQLLEVAETKDIPVGKETTPERLAEWLENHFIICYRNRKTWYDLHPILTERSERFKKLKALILAEDVPEKCE